MTFSSVVKKELEETQLLDKDKSKIYVRDIFYKHGFINDPKKKHHLEILFKTEKEATELQNILAKTNIISKVIPKAKNYLLYIKGGEDISKFLAYIGATKAVLKFEEERVVKETKNNINRIVNCEAANTDRIIGASIKHLEAINYLIEHNKFEGLPDNLKELAILRKNDPSLSTIQLGNALKISKNSVNYRLKKILEYVEKIKVE